ncbi:early endosome antigen 1-like [Gigantopelta aegis]|uniref:early endosome antigen 1-like n=1 Tax=Gigantopelta aegis TaxID=1735272 RepID=UPI001B889B08|nr:early endosome antigen 1-like [Gigantopelta aegis]
MQTMDREALVTEKYRVIEDIKKANLEVMNIRSSFDPGFSRKLYEQKQLKAQLKQKHIALTTNKLFFECMAQDPELWPSGTESEKFTEEIRDEYKKVLDEMTDKETEISSMCEMAEEAFNFLQIKLQEVEKLKENLEKKVSKLAHLKSRKNTQSVGSAVPQNVTEKLKSIDAEIAKCQDTKVIALKQLQENLKTVEELQDKVHETKKLVELKHRLEEAQLSDSSRNLENIRKLVDNIESLGEVRAHLVSVNSVCLEFLQISVYDDVNLQLLLEFSDNDLGKPVLTSAKVNETVLNVDDILSTGVKRNDVVSLIEQLKSRWTSHVPLITEINQLRDMYAIDWIPEEHLLRIIVGKKSTIVCTLEIPESYPSAGKITPVSISGDVDSEDTTILQPEGPGTLLDWAKYLEEKYRNQ